MIIQSVKDLGGYLLIKRRSQKMTQEDLATVCGVGLRFIRDLEHGKESCHMGKVLKVAFLLGVSLEIKL